MKQYANAITKSIDITEEDNGNHIIKAIVSSMNTDRDNEIVDINSLSVPRVDNKLDIPVMVNHDFSVHNVIGSVKEAEIVNNELVFTMEIMKDDELSDRVFRLLSEGHIKNPFSITFIPKRGEPDNAIGIYRNAELVEVSVVFRGSNKDARVQEIIKSIGEDKMEENKDNIIDDVKDTIEVVNKEVKLKKKKLKSKSIKEVKENVMNSKEQVNNSIDMQKAIDEAVAKAIGAIKKDEKIEQEPILQVKKNLLDDHKFVTMAQLSALSKGNYMELHKLNEIVKGSSRSKSQDYGTIGGGQELILCEELDRDIERCVGEYGNLGNAVKRVALTQSPVYRKTKVTNTVDFQPVGYCGVKPEQDIAYGDTVISPKPFAFLNVYCDELIEDQVISHYDNLVQEIGQAQARLEDTSILTFAGGTFSGEVYDASGIDATATALAGVYDSTFVTTTIPQIISTVNCCGGCNVQYAMNCATWERLKHITGVDGHFVLGTATELLGLATLGGRPVYISSVIADNVVYAGDFQNYTLVTKGGLEIVSTNSAVVNGVSLFETDRTATRARTRISGGITGTCGFAKVTLS